jgi:VDE lipocalin domain
MKRLLFICLVLVSSVRGFMPLSMSGPRSSNSVTKPFASPPKRSLSATVTTKTEPAETTATTKSIGKLVFLLPRDDDTATSKFGSASPVGNPTLLEATRHIAQKANCYADGQLEWDIMNMAELEVGSEDETSKFQDLCRVEILIAIGLTSSDDLDYVQRVFEVRRQQEPAIRQRLCHFALDCDTTQLPALVGPFDPVNPSLAATLLPWTLDATGRRMHEQMWDLFSRWRSDDFCYAIMLFVNQFSGSTVDWVKHRTDASWEKGPVKNAQEFYAMMDQCGACIVPCLKDPKCRECLGKLTQVDPRDQATSYRTLVSYESDLLTNLSLCIFTKKNIFQCDAKIPTIPKVQPIQMWRGKAATEEDGRALLVGHLDDEAAPEGSLRTNVSWKVACGANVAYDQFPCQNQLFYPAARGRDMWYDPVFRVETLDGRNVWCKRHYKVRPGPVPATFRLSVSDNGVTSDEFWTIVGVADDLSWIVFHYAGAAKTVGLRYLGGLLCTPDGSLPDESQLPEIWDCLQRAGIQPWELYAVDNRLDSPAAIDAGPPPLDFYRNEVRTRRVEAGSKE